MYDAMFVMLRHVHVALLFDDLFLSNQCSKHLSRRLRPIGVLPNEQISASGNVGLSFCITPFILPARKSRLCYIPNALDVGIFAWHKIILDVDLQLNIRWLLKSSSMTLTCAIIHANGDSLCKVDLNVSFCIRARLKVYDIRSILCNSQWNDGAEWHATFPVSQKC